MYKNRITKWRLDKRNKEPEMMAVVRKKCQRDAAGKHSEFHIRGRLVDLDDVHRYLKRKGMSIKKAIELSAATPPELRCCTPDAVPRSPMNPEVYEGPLQVFTEIRHYIFGSRDSKTWYLSADDQLYYSARDGLMVALTHFQSNLQAAYDSLKAGFHIKAGPFLINGSAYIRNVLWEEEPRMLGALFQVMIMFRKGGWVDCSNIVFKQFSDMANTIFPERHPLRQIFNHLQSFEPELAEEFFPSAWESFVDTFEEALDTSSLTLLQSRLLYVMEVESARNPDNVEAHLRTMVERYSAAHGRSDGRYGEAALVLAFVLQYRKRYTEAMAMAQEAIRCASEGKFCSAANLWCNGMETLANSQYLNYEDVEAESTLRQVIHVCAAKWGWHDGMTLGYLTKLELWLTEFGKHEEASPVSEHIAEIMRQSSAFV
jgi:hypothetical protein